MASRKPYPRGSRNPQFALPGFDFKKSFAFGGSSVAKSNPKTARHIDPKGMLHLVLRSTLAKGERSFLMRDRGIRKILNDQAAATGVQIKGFANAGNHLHLIMSPHSRRAFKRFIRASTGLIARKTLGAERNSPWRKTPSKLTTAASQSNSSHGTPSSTAPGNASHRAASSTASRTRFWDARPFTRIVTGGRDYLGLKRYLELNRIEVATGLDRDSARGLMDELERRAYFSGLATGFG